jgi:hypothetical protein
MNPRTLLIIASLIAEKKFTFETFKNYTQLCACFCSAHFKDIPPKHANIDFLKRLQIDDLIDEFYPTDIFSELYDEVKSFDHYTKKIINTIGVS